MQSKIVEVALVSTLFIGYLVLWKFKQKSLLSRININTEIIYRDSRPTQRFFDSFATPPMLDFSCCASVFVGIVLSINPFLHFFFYNIMGFL